MQVVGGTSWFKDTPHYWAEASLPLAYAVACVEVVSESSEKACVLCNLLEASIYHHWTNMGMFAIYRAHLFRPLAPPLHPIAD